MNAKPIIKELTDNEYEDQLNVNYGDVDVCGLPYPAGQVLREIDPTAFECGKSDFEDGLEPEEWECGDCGTVFDNEDEAEDCCKKECKNCGELFEPNSASQNNPDFCCDDCNYEYYEDEEV